MKTNTKDKSAQPQTGGKYRHTYPQASCGEHPMIRAFLTSITLHDL